MKYVTYSIITMIVMWLVFALIASSKHREEALTALEWNHYQASCGEHQIKIKNGITALSNNSPSSVQYFSIFLPKIVQKVELYDSQMTLLFSDWIRSNRPQTINYLYQNNYYHGDNQSDGYHLILPNEINLSEKQFNALSDCLEKEKLVDLYTDGPTSTPEENQNADLSKISMGVKSLTMLSDDCKQKKEIIFYDGEGPVEISFIGAQEYCANDSFDNISGEVKITNISESPITINYHTGDSSFLTLKTTTVSETISDGSQAINVPTLEEATITTIELAPTESVVMQSWSRHLNIIDNLVKNKVDLNGKPVSEASERKFYMNYSLYFEVKDFGAITRDFLIGLTVIHI